MNRSEKIGRSVSLDVVDGGKKPTKDQCLKFMRERFLAKECNRFVPKTSKTRRLGIETCHCGGESDDHVTLDENQQLRRSAFWSPENDIFKIPTNAFGKIQFNAVEFRQKAAKYIRLSDDADITDTVKLVDTYWDMSKNAPKLLVSVFGDGWDFNMTDTMKKQIFHRGLIPAVEATNGWMTTFGLEIGVAKVVGEAIREGEFLFEEGGRIKRVIQCIGIVPWGYVHNRDHLVIGENIEDEHLKTYKRVDFGTDPIDPNENSLPLNPYHTHFLLVDDGRRNKERPVAEFRAALEKKISEPRASGGLDIPVVGVSVGGGFRCIEHVERSVTIGLPVLICEGSGRASDAIAHVYRKFKDLSPDANGKEPDYSSFEGEIMAKLEKALYENGNKKEEKSQKKLKKAAQQIISICRNPKFVFIVHVSQGENFETAILLCLLECQGADIEKQLNLAIQWNRDDVARAKLFSSSFHLDPINNKAHSEYFMKALLDDKLGFIKLFIDHGFPLGRFLGVAKLRELYARSATNATFIWHLLKLTEKRSELTWNGIYLIQIYHLLQFLTRRFRHPIYMKDTPIEEQLQYSQATYHYCDQPFKHLFLWALLLNKQDLADYFWEQCEEPLALSLAATLICDRLAEYAKTISSELSRQYDNDKAKFEKNAIGLIDVAFSAEREKAVQLIYSKSPLWGDMSCIEMAAFANDVDFLATSCCQTAVLSEWKRGFEASGLNLVIATFTLLPVIWMVNFEDEDIYVRNKLLAGHQQSQHSKIHSLKLKRSISSRHPVTYCKINRRTNRNSLPQIVFNSPSSAAPFLQSSKGAQAKPKNSTWNWRSKIYKFYTSPVIKFTNHVFWYVLFLFLHAYVLLFSFRWKITVPEIILHFWTFSFLCEFIRLIVLSPAKTIRDKFLDYWEYSSFTMWNRLEMLNFMFFILILITRCFSYTFFMARVFLAVNFILYTFRMYKYFMANSYLGPKVIMMLKMTRDLFMFMMLLIVLMISYSVSSQALLYPHRPFYSGIFYDLFDHGIWDVFGDLDSTITEPSLPKCGSSETESSSMNSSLSIWMAEKDCTSRGWPVPLLLAIYLFFGNILLVNMLIAIFASIFEEVQKHSEQIWKSLMYFLVEEYRQKLLFPPPLNALSYFYILISSLCKKKKSKSDFDTARQERDQQERSKISNVFESFCLTKYLELKKSETDKSADTLLKEINETVTKMSKILATIRPKRFERKTTSKEAVLRFRGGPVDFEDGKSDLEYENEEDGELDLNSIIFH